jgi:hypothetical protein
MKKYSLFSLAPKLLLANAGIRNVILFFFIVNAQMTFSQQSDTTQVTEEDSTKQFISNVIAEVNRRSELIDNIISEGEVTIKTKDIDNSGSIEEKVKKKDDVWFHITGPLGINIAEAHFGRKTFVFYNARADEVVTGSSSIHNIGTLAKVRCTFDDMLNVFSGTVRIPKAKSDSLSISEEGSNYVVQLVRGSITRRYWVDKTYYSVFKYAYYGATGSSSPISRMSVKARMQKKWKSEDLNRENILSLSLRP